MIRRATLADLPAVTTLFAHTVRNVSIRHYDAAQVAAWAAGSENVDRWQERLTQHHFLVTEQGGQLTGMASLTAEGYLDVLFVHADHQGNGIASRLLGRLLHHAAAQRLARVTTEASITARPVFESMGFRVVQAQQVEVRGQWFRNYRMEVSVPPPMLETRRLLLFPFTLADATDFYALNQDPDVMRYTGDTAFSSFREARAFLEHYSETTYRPYGYGRWTVLRRETGEYLGWCGLKYLPELGETDLGYRFYRHAWGQGYATEAARACLTYGFEMLGLTRVVGRALRANDASIRVLEKVGMHFEKLFPSAKPRAFATRWTSTPTRRRRPPDFIPTLF
ncbi:Protein N-acetyltransferase, RimJ/RimL family [Catalinimonas alkaloidigena]|uniref:Protein N-acetyltransferase, RimJ/RimL family n=1 Tax=Catalinimonas alkaloidigena TaxID=1075417 RepID=A0A1G9UML1_9BACT|nr:GNAT family N-acetyltransferase [Catalinimonas alkaloidigena]SDM61121.1 Protein N-acetyltransferase, RimJ/RimL family [Catalinimonas alkaloidigena]